jgi:predicted N-acetyltransferase YhbS
MLTVRPATATDEELARTLANQAFDELRHIYRPKASAQANLRAVEGSLLRLVAIEDDEMVGTVRYEIEGTNLYLMGLAVCRKRRRQGIARLLLRALIDIASSNGCRTISLRTVTETGLVPIFRRYGFHVVSQSSAERFESPTGESLTETYMQRDLDGPLFSGDTAETKCQGPH